MFEPLLSIVSLYLLYGLICFSLRGKESGYLLLLGCLLAMGVLAVVESISFFGEDLVGPSFMPVVCGALLSLCASSEILREFGKGLEGGNKSSDSRLAIVSVSIGTIFLYLIMLPYVGYFFASALFLILLSAVLGLRKPLPVIGLTVGWLVFVYCVFVRLLQIPLPEGMVISWIF